MGTDLSRTPEGHLLIPADRQGNLKDADPKELRLTSIMDDLLISISRHPGERARPLFYGDLRLFHVGELMALVSSMRKDGTLHLLVPHARKTVYFQEGEIVFATSTVEDDRLGEVLWRRGHLTLEQLSEVHDLVTPGKKLGKVLIERGLITPRQLYEGIKEQVLEILYSTFHFRKGEFVFIEGKVPLKSTVRLDMNTRDALMEGIRRVEEMTRLEELFPEREHILVPKRMDADLGELEQSLHGLIDGKRSVKDIINESRLGEFDALKALAKLHRLGVISVKDDAGTSLAEHESLPRALEAFSRSLRTIHQTLKVEASGEEERLEAYLGSPSPKHREVFLNVGFDADGRLDMDTLYRNARRSLVEDPRMLAMEALRGLYDYAVFQAMDALDDAACDVMMDKLQAARCAQDEAGKD